MAVGLLKGAYWVVLAPAWNEIDEAQHFGYVESLARGHGVPTVGKDLVTDRELESIKLGTTSPYRYHPYQPSARDTNWGGTSHQYEAIHGPTYYLLMTPAYWLGAPFGIAGSLYAIRFATVLLGVLVVPLVWMLARRLFPDRPVIWLLSAGVLVVIDKLYPGTVGNDIMVLTVGTTAVLLLLRSLDDPSRPLWAVTFGVATSATIMAKTTSLALIPMAALITLAWLVTMRPARSVVLRWAAIVIAAMTVTILPWLTWNFHTYGAPNASEQVDALLTGGLQAPDESLSVDTLKRHVGVARGSGVWSQQGTKGRQYTRFWESVFIMTAVGGVAASALRRKWRDIGPLLWCASALPLAYISNEVIVWIVFGGASGPLGRFLVIALAPSAVLIAAGCVAIFDERWGSVVVGAILATSLVIAMPMYNRYIRTWYMDFARDDNVAPVETQTWSDLAVPMQPIRLETTCPVQAIGIGFEDQDIPTEIGITTPGGAMVTGVLDTEPHGPDSSVHQFVMHQFVVHKFVPTYQLSEPAMGELTVTVSRETGVNAAAEDAMPWVSMVGTTYDPVIMVFCQVPDAQQVAFAAIYPTLHPDWVTLAWLRRIPILFALIGSGGAITMLGLAIAGSVGDLRRRR